jgi:hypothetical protein
MSLRVEEVKIKDLKLDPENARRHSEQQLKALATSLHEFGQQRPAVVGADNIVYAGNGMIEAARALGWENISIVKLPFDDPVKCRAFAIADNRTSDLATWDDKELLSTLEKLDSENQLELVGFASHDIDDLKALLSEMESIELYNSGVFGDSDESAENVQSQDSFSDKAKEYATRSIRSIMLEYPLEQFAWAIKILTKLREERNLQSNADAILLLLQDYSKEAYPIDNNT